MAMFAMYASNKEQQQQTVDNDMDDIENDDGDAQKEEEEDDKEDDGEQKNMNNDDADNGTSPPLNPLIPSHNATEMKLNPLDNLRERYNKQNIPQSLQPDALSNAFQSENQKAIQNDLNEDDSLLNGIRQSVQMMTHSND